MEFNILKRVKLTLLLMMISLNVFASLTDQAQQSSPSKQEISKHLKMVAVPAGCFSMGSTLKDAKADEKPQHKVCLERFEIGQFEVTQALWEMVMAKNPASHKQCGPSCPVEKVSWNTVQKFIQKLNKIMSTHFRLPTEAEWEFACRSGGKDTHKYCGDDNIEAVSWYDKNSGFKAHPVGKKSANALGIFDMSGNVSEWVQDKYDPDFYKTSPTKNPQGPKTGALRVQRGGSWLFGEKSSRISRRFSSKPRSLSYESGFRLARSLTR